MAPRRVLLVSVLLVIVAIRVSLKVKNEGMRESEEIEERMMIIIIKKRVLLSNY